MDMDVHELHEWLEALTEVNEAKNEALEAMKNRLK
jgi:hypothetical protein